MHVPLIMQECLILYIGFPQVQMSGNQLIAQLNGQSFQVEVSYFPFLLLQSLQQRWP